MCVCVGGGGDNPVFRTPAALVCYFPRSIPCESPLVGVRTVGSHVVNGPTPQNPQADQIVQ